MNTFESFDHLFESTLMSLYCSEDKLFILRLKRNSEIKQREAHEMIHLYESMYQFINGKFPLILIPPGAFNLNLKARQILAPEMQDQFMFAKACIAENVSNKGLIRMTSTIMECKVGEKVEIFDSLEDATKWCIQQMETLNYMPSFNSLDLKAYLSSQKEQILSVPQ